MQQTAILKFTPATLHHPPSSSSIINNYSNFPNTHRITNNKPFQFTNFPITNNNKPFHISSCSNKDNTDSVLDKDVPKNSTLTTEKKLRFHVSSAFEPIFSFVKWVFSSVTELVSPQRSSFIEEDDLVLVKHNGKKIAGVVQHVVHHRDGLIETTLQSELGLLENLKLTIYDIANQTERYEENEKLWGIHTLVECKDDGFRNMEEEIKDILNAHDELQFNLYNFVVQDSIYPTMILVKSFVTVSKLRTPRFEHYMEVRRKVLSEIDEIRCKHGGSKEESEVLVEIDNIQSK